MAIAYGKNQGVVTAGHHLALTCKNGKEIDTAHLSILYFEQLTITSTNIYMISQLSKTNNAILSLKPFFKLIRNESFVQVLKINSGRTGNTPWKSRTSMTSCLSISQNSLKLMYLSHSHESKVNSSKTNGQGVQLRGNKPITDKDPGGHIFPKSYKLKATPFETSVIIHTQLSLTTTLISYLKRNHDFHRCV